MKKTKLFLTLFALLAFGPTAWAQLTGSGTSSDPYLITSTEDWNTFAASVNNGTETYYGKTVKLNADIPPVSTMVGNSTENSFQGTFNGDGHTITFNKGTAEAPFDEDFCAPFRYIRSATIKNLHTTGTIYTSGKRAGGIVATATFPFGCSLSSCRSSMTIHGTKNDYGGLVAHVNFENFSYSRNFNITNCLFDGTLVDDGSSEKWGGFIGWVTCEHYTDARLNITNCLFNPVDVPSVSGCKTFVRYGCEDKYIVITNCYYKMTLGDDAQGTTDASDMNNATLLANLGSGWEIVTENNVEMVVPFVPSLRPFTGGAGTEESPYQIASDTDWDNLAYNVSTCEENYSGKYFILMNNIDVSTMIGKGTTSDTDNIPFCGTFDGNGHKLTVTYTNNTVQHTAPFRFAKDVTIKNLHVAGTITTNQQRAGGIIANAQGTIAITNCVSSVIINSSVSGDGTSGGFVATIRNNGNVTIDGCAFVGKLLGSNTTNCGGFVGHTRTNDNAYLTVRNSLFDPEQTTMSGGCATFSRTHSNPGDKLSINNCYYTQSFGTEQGKQADTITSANNNVSLAFAGNPSSNTTLGVIGYGTGIKYNNVLYAGVGDNVSLSITAPEGYAINTVSYTYEGGSETTIDPIQGVYSFTMPDANVTINATLWNVYTKDITAYTSGENDGWYLIASPIGTVNPENVDNMISESDFDLYRFNQAVDLEWENWKDIEHNNHHFDLEPGRGYLYANSEDVTLTFTGTPNDGDGSVSLACTNDNPHENMRGWNLIGNPFGITAYIDREYYVMNTDGSDIIVSNRADYYVEAMEGIFVQANEDGETLTFTTNAPGKGHIQKPEPKQVVLNLSRDRGSVIDRAIVRMGEGQTLPKFQIRESSTKIYIPQDGKEYAIAISDMQGEMPVNFKANQSGSYTLMVSPENMEMNYLHLIDNLTGADVDLLTTSSYTFLAKTTDYESRFKLVFVANENDNENGNETFAFFSNGNWIIVNEGEATLQVVDVLGHVFSSERFSGNYEKKLDVAPGVYMLRLINGDDVRTQKMVIK